MRKRIFITVGIVLFTFAAVWRFVLVPRWTERIPAGWQWQAHYTGYQTNADPQTGILPEKDSASNNSHAITTVTDSRQRGSVELHDRFTSHDITSGQVTYEYDYRAFVDPRTGAHLKEEYQGDYFVFPRNVEQKTYRLRFSYVKGIPLAFQREEEVEGLATYLFAYKGRGEYTETYLGTAAFPGVKVPPGQEIKCADDQFIYKVWVEPVTGEVVKSEDSCHSNDYLYEIATGKQLAVVDHWGTETAGDDVIHHVAAARGERSKILWQTRYIPSSLFVAGLLSFGLVMLPRRPISNENA